MMSCDYNGWADVPESEREELDVFESGLPDRYPLLDLLHLLGSDAAHGGRSMRAR